ncbi:MAG: NUDIX hydrolase [Alphaproteobacteria bacterium]|nr:NUDIX hydrolase [Alphaproteobacteria bacterium]
MKKIIYLMGILISFPLFAVQFQCALGPVERAGMILIKDYAGTPCVLVGKDKRQGYVNFPAGECDLSDHYSSKAAARETMEETGNALHFSSKDVSKMDYVYSNRHKIQLFVHRDDNLSVTTLTASVVAAQSNAALGREYKEVDQYYAIPIQNLLDVAKGIINAGYPSSQNISAQGLNAICSKNGHNLVFESHYIAAIAQNYVNAKNIFENITGQIFQ